MRDDTATPTDLALSGFAVLWSLATLFHIGSFGEWGRSVVDFALAAAAVCVLARPASVERLLVLALVQGCHVLATVPNVSNHWIFTAFINASLLSAYAITSVQQQTLALTRAQLWASFAPVARVQVLLLYAFVVLHKLNWDYFSPELSCGAFFYRAQREVLPFLPEGPLFERISSLLTLAVEAAVPLLLIGRRTRSAGIFLGAVFHAAIALNPLSHFYNFSGMLFAVYFLFAPETTAQQALALWERSAVRRALRSARELPYARALAVRGGLVLGGLAALTALALVCRGRDFFLVLWVLYSASAIGLLLVLVWSTRDGLPSAPGVFRICPRLLLALPALLLINGMSPYLGLKTDTSFSMFSNLRTEGGRSNHFFVPDGLQLFSYQRDLVSIAQSSDPFLQSVAAGQLVVPFFEVQRRAAADTVFSRVGSAMQEHWLPSRAPWRTRALGKLLLFRTVDRGEHQSCQH